jgi:bacillithiol biosynthesis cysteine-adding enzyme BshC
MQLVSSVPLGEALAGAALLGDYLAGHPQATRYFAHPFADADAYRAAAQARSAQTFRADRGALADVLARQNAEFGASPAAQQAIERLRSPDSLAVVTGQQPGLLTGPAYTVYKAVSAISLARRLSDELGAPCVPVFWMETDDTDRGEVDWACVVDAAGEAVRIALEVPPGWEGRPVGDYPVAGPGEAVIGALDAALPDSDFKPAVLDWARGAAAGSERLATWFARLMAALFADHGLVMLDVNDAAVKRLSAPVFEFAIDQPLAATDCAMQGACNLAARGYHAQVHKEAHAAAFFLMEGGRRHRVDHDGAAFQVNGETRTADDLKRRLAERPQDFDCNVLLRPLAQDYLLPTVAYVAGPHEVAYFAQTGALYRAAGIAMPVIVPRASASLVTPAVARLLEEHDLKPNDLRGEPEAVLTQLARAAHGDEVAATFAEARARLEALAGDLERAAAGVDPSLSDSVTNTRARFLREIERLEEKAVKALRRHDEQLAERVRHAQAALFPRGEMQERVISIASFLARRGMGLVGELIDHLAGTEGRHTVFSWGKGDPVGRP